MKLRLLPLLLVLLLPLFFSYSCQVKRLTVQEYQTWYNEKKQLLTVARDTVNEIRYELAFVPNELHYLQSIGEDLSTKDKKELLHSKSVHFVLTIEFPKLLSKGYEKKQGYFDNELMKTFFSISTDKANVISDEVYYENALQSMSTHRIDVFFDKTIVNSSSVFIFDDKLYSGNQIIFELSKLQTMNLPKIKIQ